MFRSLLEIFEGHTVSPVHSFFHQYITIKYVFSLKDTKATTFMKTNIIWTLKCLDLNRLWQIKGSSVGFNADFLNIAQVILTMQHQKKQWNITLLYGKPVLDSLTLEVPNHILRSHLMTVSLVKICSPWVKVSSSLINNLIFEHLRVLLYFY